MKALKMLAGMVMACGVYAAPAAAANLEDMVGKWNWSEFTVVVTQCDATGVCAEVVAGPKNVGMQMIKSKLESKDGGFVGQIAHPMTGDTYNAMMKFTDANTWHMDGCTPQNVCASGDFTRIQ